MIMSTSHALRHALLASTAFAAVCLPHASQAQQYWNGAATAGPAPGPVTGGTGTWNTVNGNWSNAAGTLNDTMSPNPGSVIFSATPGVVTVDNSFGAIGVTGMQFTTSGYLITGDAVTLEDPGAVIAVGDGTPAGAGMVATIESALTGAGGLVKTDRGTLILTGANNYGGATVVNGGVVQAGAANTFSQTSATTVNAGGTLDLGGFAQAIDSVALAGGTLTNGALAGAISSTGGLVSGLSGTATLSLSSGTTTLTGANAYTGVTTINGATLLAGNANAFSATSAARVNVGGTLNLGGFAQTINAVALAGGTLTNGTLAGSVASTGGTISNLAGTASLATTAGTTVLSGTNSYTGATSISGSVLQIAGSLQNSNVFVNAGAALQVTGTMSGNLVTVNAGGALSGTGTASQVVSVGGTLIATPGATLTMSSVALDAASNVNVDVSAAGGSGVPFNVTGNLTLDGTLNLTDAAPFGAGITRLLSYGGTLTNNGLDIGVIPPGMAPANLSVQNGIPGQINLVNSGGLPLQFWNGPAPAGPGTGTVNGGSGSWRVTNANWTDADGTFNAPATYPAFAVFQGAPGTITVDSSSGAVMASGMQFAVDGYRIVGDSITLTAPQSLIRVGDGTSASSGYTATIASALTGAGGLLKTDAGTLILSGANSYTGATVVEGGRLQAGAANVFSAASATTVTGSNARLDLGGFAQTINNVVLVNGGGVVNGTLSGSVVSHSGIIGGLGGTVQVTVGTSTDGPTLFFPGNTYTGDTIVNGSVLAGAGDMSRFSHTRINAGGMISLNGGSHVIDQITLSGGLIGGGSIAGAITSQGGILSGIGGTATLTTLSGSTTLDNTNSYSGATNVNGGTLSVNGTLLASALTVNAGGTLGGTGTVGTTVINGGTLAPGNSIGTLTVQGNLLLDAAARYMLEVSPASSDRVNVTGTATLGGAAVNASFASGSYIAKQYTILNAVGGRVGTFGAQANTNLPANFKSSLSYDANNAYLDLTLNFDPPPTPPDGPVPPDFGTGLNGNQRNVANTLVNYFNTAGGIPLAFGALTPMGLTQASGETATGAQQATFDAMTQFMGIMTDPSAAGRNVAGQGANAFAEETALGYAPRQRRTHEAFAMATKAAPVVPAFEGYWNVWAAGFGGSRATDGNGVTGSNDTRSSLAGFAVGADYRLAPNTLAGFSMAGGGTTFSVANGGSGRSDLFQVGAFVRHHVGSAYVTAAAAYGWQDISTDRSVGGLDRLRARFDANAYSGRVEVGNRVTMPWVGGVGLTPYAAAQVTAFDLPAYAEQAAGASLFALNYAAKTAVATRSELGLRGDKSFAMQDAILTLRGRAAWAHDFNRDRSIAATFQSLPGTSFVVNGARQSAHAALTSASAEVTFTNGISLAATFDGEFSDVTQTYAGKGVMRYTW